MICNVLIHNMYVLVASLLSLTILPKQPNNAFPPVRKRCSVRTPQAARAKFCAPAARSFGN